MTTGQHAAVAVTGASGFVGGATIRALRAADLLVRAISRKPEPRDLAEGVNWSIVPDYRDARAIERAVAGARCVIHLADDPDRTSPRAAGESASIAANLIRAMAASGTSRLILASSVYARLAPRAGGYGAAKRAAETEVLSASGLQAVVLRIPPVYGPGCRGGFGTLAALVRRGLPIPFARAVAPRAYLSRRNLCDLLVSIAGADDRQWAAAAGRCFEPSDGRPVGTADLVRMLGHACRRPAWQIAVPLPALRAVGRLTGKAAVIAGALDPLDVIGNEPLTQIFGWRPAEQMPASLAFLGEFPEGGCE
jgi:UDP-glucose 4-epimerase